MAVCITHRWGLASLHSANKFHRIAHERIAAAEHRSDEMKKIYVDVDTQFDFCDPDGALFVERAPAAVAACARLIRHAVSREIMIVGSVDTHTHESWEFATNRNVGPSGQKPNFPPHCVKGTRGWAKVAETLPDRFCFIPPDAAEPHVVPRSQ